jgi:hypothetical protein
MALQLLHALLLLLVNMAQDAESRTETMILNSKVHACRSFIEVALADSVCFTQNLDLAPEI